MAVNVSKWMLTLIMTLHSQTTRTLPSLCFLKIHHSETWWSWTTEIKNLDEVLSTLQTARVSSGKNQCVVWSEPGIYRTCAELWCQSKGPACIYAAFEHNSWWSDVNCWCLGSCSTLFGAQTLWKNPWQTVPTPATKIIGVTVTIGWA